MYQIDYLKAVDDHRREELSRSWANHRPRHRALLNALFGARQVR